MRIELPIVSPCVGCGNCCRSIGLPPFEVANPDLGPQPKEPTPGGCRTCEQLRDMSTFANMPSSLRAAHAELVKNLKSDPSGKPCAWLDTETGRCINYEHRPAVCQDFTVGSAECVHLQTGEPQCVWNDNTIPEVWRNPRGKGRDKPKSKIRHPRSPWRRLGEWVGRNFVRVQRVGYILPEDFRKRGHWTITIHLPRYELYLELWLIRLSRRRYVTRCDDPCEDELK